jgi:cystathionine beta-synthase
MNDRPRGNTGIGLAVHAAHLGYRTVVFATAATSLEKRSLLAAYGAEVRVVNAMPFQHVVFDSVI